MAYQKGGSIFATAKNTQTGETREIRASLATLKKWDWEAVSPCSGPCKCRVEAFEGECHKGWRSKFTELIGL